jgi:transcriptional regulator with XRE-family HTH domain
MSDGENIRNMRRKKGLTQEELGGLLGVGKSAVSRWESGEREVTLGTMRAIAAALAVTLESLVEGLDSAEESTSIERRTGNREGRDAVYGSENNRGRMAIDETSGRGADEADPDHIGAISEKQGSFSDQSQINLTIPRIDDPELISAFEGFKELDKLTPSDIDDIKAILKLAQRIIDKRRKGE